MRGGWLPTDQGALEAWLSGVRSKAEAGEQPPLHPVMVEFQELIATDPVVRMYLEQMIAEVPKRKKYRQRHLKSIEQMLTLINETHGSTRAYVRGLGVDDDVLASLERALLDDL